MSIIFNEFNILHFSHQSNIRGWIATQRLNAFVDVWLLKTLVLHHDFFPFVSHLDQLLWEPRYSLLWHKFKLGMLFSDSSPTPSPYHKHCKMASFPHSFKPFWTSLRSLPCSPQKSSGIKFWVLSSRMVIISSCNKSFLYQCKIWGGGMEARGRGRESKGAKGALISV